MFSLGDSPQRSSSYYFLAVHSFCRMKTICILTALSISCRPLPSRSLMSLIELRARERVKQSIQQSKRFGRGVDLYNKVRYR